MKDDQQEAFERVLSATLARILDLLKFAEAKNAALLTFASAWILGSINLLMGSAKLTGDWRISFIVALPLFALAGLIAIVSFLPKMLLSVFHQDPEQSKALLYFGDAASFAPAAYRDRVRDRYYPPENESATRNYLDDLSIQIAVVSQITKRKLQFFNWGALIVLIALAALAIPAIRAVWQLVAPRLGVS
ncbi:Pycsar system effector family protein [Methylobacterium soli]|uniref:Pycsar effector protein domain-containing protein n=1 Tax=Methylobacterium soli TaxID=553447 RepID=A0A6L3SNX8_9HYPH|nr:Pycsar system effector family protein [Methylobacterium soli]KAB1070173.1 hypothetical protein F6X53_30360 [Methylobacterium soli]GJE43557.1 hypothetical protein AEGHOMDF_2736 [Methylobacterium soli]